MLLPLLLPSSSEVAVVGEGVVVRAEVEVEEEANDDDDDDNDDIFGGERLSQLGGRKSVVLCAIDELRPNSADQNQADRSFR